MPRNCLLFLKVNLQLFGKKLIFVNKKISGISIEEQFLLVQEDIEEVIQYFVVGGVACRSRVSSEPVCPKRELRIKRGCGGLEPSACCVDNVSILVHLNSQKLHWVVHDGHRIGRREQLDC